jgi:transglutaminase-like putative cysteine protease
MPERLAVLAAVMLFSGWHWSQLERPQLSAAELAVLVVLAAMPAVLDAIGRRRWAIAALPLAVWIAVWSAFGYQPWQLDHQLYPLRVAAGLRDGARSWFDAVTPFDPGRFPLTDGLVQLAFFALAAVFAWLLLDGRRALTSVAAAFALFAIPSTALTSGSSGLRAAMFLVLALAILTVCQPGSTVRGVALGQLAVLGTATVVAGLVVAAAPGVAKGALFDWRNWNPLGGTPGQVSVGYVWDQHYGPLKWPKKHTTVFEVISPRPLYWKATTLSEFNADHWQGAPAILYPYPSTSSVGFPETLLPEKAVTSDRSRDIVQATIKVDGLADQHLLSTGQPLRYDISPGIAATLYTDGTLYADRDLSRGTTYTIRAYAPDPSPRQLSQAGTQFPQDVTSGIVVNTNQLPIYPAQSDAANLAQIIGPQFESAVQQVWHRSGADQAGSEYGAVVAVEAYLRAKPFRYDQTPRYRKGVPVLVDFMTHAHAGYCQMFAGAMALVLRTHGIPVRVAVGFTEGSASSTNHYVVQDRDAHAWVEAYFPGYGWLPFDPTPSRALTQQASTSSSIFSKVASYADVFPNGVPNATAPITKSLSPSRPGGKQVGPPSHGHKDVGGTGQTLVAAPPSHHGRSLLAWLLTAAGALVAALAAVKLVAVQWRYLRPGPRAQAAAAYHELSTYVGDQGISVPANATFEELAELVEATWGVDAGALAATGSAARYAPPERAAAAGSEVRPQLRRVKREIRRLLSRRERATGALRVRAVLAQTTHLE